MALTAAVFALVSLAIVDSFVYSPSLLLRLGFEVPAAAALVWLLIRWGVLPMIVASFIFEVAIHTPLTTDFTAWYSGPTMLALATVLALAISSFSVALAGRPLFEEELLEHA